MCAFWARGFCLRKFTLVLWLGLNTYPSEPPDASLRTLLRYSLPQGSHVDSIEQWVDRRKAEDVLVVIDGVENQAKSFMSYVVLEKSLKKATVILAASNNPMYLTLYRYLNQYDMIGLSEEQILKQVIQHYHRNTSRAEEFLMYISETRNIRALCYSPPYLATVLFVFDSMDDSDPHPCTLTQLFTRLLKLLGLPSHFPRTRTQIFTRLFRRSGLPDDDTLAILTSKAYEVTIITDSSFDWHDQFTNFCSRISPPYRTVVAPADHCCFTLELLQHYLCARHIHSLPRDQQVAKLNQTTVPLNVRQLYVGLCSSFKVAKMVLKYPDLLLYAACISEIPIVGLRDLMSSLLSFKHQWLTTLNIHYILQAVYYSGLPCKLQFHSCYFGSQAALEAMVRGLPIPTGGTVQELW